MWYVMCEQTFVCLQEIVRPFLLIRPDQDREGSTPVHVR